VIGAAAQVPVDLPPVRRLPALRTVLVAALVLALGELSLPVASSSTGQKFPGQTLRAAVVRRPGCVTSDHPSRLILMDVLSRNLERGCPLVVDLGGANYDVPAPVEISNRVAKTPCSSTTRASRLSLRPYPLTKLPVLLMVF